MFVGEKVELWGCHEKGRKSELKIYSLIPM